MQKDANFPGGLRTRFVDGCLASGAGDSGLIQSTVFVYAGHPGLQRL